MERRERPLVLVVAVDAPGCPPGLVVETLLRGEILVALGALIVGISRDYKPRVSK